MVERPCRPVWVQGCGVLEALRELLQRAVCVQDGAAMSLADDLFSASLKLAETEARLGDALDATGQPWDDFSFDWYDRSVEVYCVEPPPDPDGLAAKMFADGFSICWVHPHRKGDMRSECNNTLCPRHNAPKAVA